MPEITHNQPPEIFGTANVAVDSLITKHSRRESENIVRLIIEEITGHPYIRYKLDPTLCFSDEEYSIFSDWMTKIKRGIPVQHLIGKVTFWKQELIVSEHVLIPRPETEELVEWISNEHKNHKGLHVLDIGTGSGCIAIALAGELRNNTVQAIDRSEAALEVARRNAELNHTDIHYIKKDILEAGNSDFSELDIIVSNPPYIPLSEKSEMDTHVLHEPDIALFVPDDLPLLFFDKIAELGMHWLKPGGWLYFECHEDFAGDVETIMKEKGFIVTEIKNDLQGKQRMVRGRKPLE